MTKPDWTTKEFREPYWQQAREILAAYSEELQVDTSAFGITTGRAIVHLVPVKRNKKSEALWKRLGEIKGFEERNKVMHYTKPSLLYGTLALPLVE